ncbi:MAG: hypothetical protein HY535_07265 [Chloroflexi bacterium]|nr:hypothetical protein [Chloroflexota bacterium]
MRASPRRLISTHEMIALLFFIGAATTACGTQDKQAPLGQAVATGTTAQEVAAAGLRQVDVGQGNVTVEATWVAPVHLQEMPQDPIRDYSPDRFVLIHVKLDTHSVDLGSYDLPRLAALSGRDGRPREAEAWLGIEESSHHREGVLVFAGMSNGEWEPRERSAQLAFGELAGVSERVLRWQF